MTQQPEPWERPQEPTATEEDVYHCFRLLLGRAPAQHEWTGHRTHVGKALGGVVQGYLDSLEFALRAEKLRPSQVGAEYAVRQLDGFRLWVRPTDQIVGHFIQDGTVYEPHVTNVFRDRLRPGMRVIDAGANIGYFTMLAASLVGATGSVVAVEPGAESIKLVEMSRRANGFAHVRPVQAAAARDFGTLVFNPFHSNGTTAGLPGADGALLAATTVPSVRLDRLVAPDERVDFVKLDIEGAEYAAMLGATDLLRRWRPVIVSEFAPDLMPGISGGTAEDYLRLLFSLGYRAWHVRHDATGLTACEDDIGRVMALYADSGGDHIDLLFEA